MTDTSTKPNESFCPTDGYDPIGMSQREIRVAMLANGYEPLPLIGKAPIPKKWEQIVIDGEMIHGWANAGPTATAPVLDIDILDEQAAQLVEATARLYLEDKGQVLVRIGLPPKRAILLSTDKPFKKIIRKLTAPDGKVHRIEVLGDGQQLAVAGTHPDTREPYVWKDGRSPVNTPRAELPLIQEDEIRTILDLCAGELKAKLGWVELDVAPAADTNGYEADPTYTPIYERVERIQYAGEYPINDTLLAYTGEQLRNGVSSDDLINDCRARVQKAYDDIPGNPQERPVWDWIRIHHQIDAMVYGYIEKNCKDEPRIIETLPVGMLEKWRKIEKLGGSPTFRKRRHWGVEDMGPAEEIPTIEGPPIAPEKLKRHRPANILVPFRAFDVASLPRRRWLLDQHYMRGVVSITAGMGGRGKSSNSLVEAIVLATARPLLREPPGEHCRVWYHCGDDNMEELHRRVAAICQRYNLDMAELEGWLFLTTPREFELRVAEGYMDVKTDNAAIKRIHDQVEANSVDVAILDPLVKLHLVAQEKPANG
jgi:hypothetical protein